MELVRSGTFKVSNLYFDNEGKGENILRLLKDGFDLGIDKLFLEEDKTGIYCKSNYQPSTSVSRPVQLIQHLANKVSDTIELWKRHGVTLEPILPESNPETSSYSVSLKPTVGQEQAFKNLIEILIDFPEKVRAAARTF